MPELSLPEEVSAEVLPLFSTVTGEFCEAVVAIVHLPSKLAFSSITRDFAAILPMTLPVERSSSFPFAEISPCTLPEIIKFCAEIFPSTAPLAPIISSFSQRQLPLMVPSIRMESGADKLPSKTAPSPIIVLIFAFVSVP